MLVSAADPRRGNRFWLGADLALEVVSADKPERDLVEKRGDYAEGRVPEYWIVNPQTETITVLRFAVMLMKKQALIVGGNLRRRNCSQVSRSTLPRYSTQTETAFGDLLATGRFMSRENAVSHPPPYFFTVVAG